MPKKIDFEKLEKELMYERKNCWEVWDEKTKDQAFSFAEKYKQFLDRSKTAREAVRSVVSLAAKKGFAPIESFKKLKAGDKIYFINREKAIMLARIGRKGFDNGFRMLMAHIDVPHLDLKVNPLYEDEKMAFFKTHYYGGIKKYQWTTIALALHGIVYLANGKKVEISIGEKENDPVFIITDLLPHLDREGGPGTKVGPREVKGEDLNLMVGSMPVNDKKTKEKVKLAILDYLNKEFGMVEEDFTSADLEAVPCEKARDLGFDRSMIAAHGHDDRICSFASVAGLLDSKTSDETQICALVDREETGSEGVTGAQSTFFELFISDILHKEKGKSSMDNVYRIFSKSKAISADATPAIDPDYKDVHDLRNAIRIGNGVAIEKFGGAGGKYYTNEASGKFVRELRMLFKKNPAIVYQTSGAMGKVDMGGGGTIAKYIANRNVEIIDAGVPALNLHAPMEIASKADLYSTYLAFKTFIEN
jgi:aspartyl aminopeptidase